MNYWTLLGTFCLQSCFTLEKPTDFDLKKHQAQKILDFRITWMNPTEKIKEFPDIRVLNFINLLFSHPTSNKYGDNLSSLPKRNMKEKLPTFPTYKFKLCISSRIFHFFLLEKHLLEQVVIVIKFMNFLFFSCLFDSERTSCYWIDNRIFEI